MYNKLSISCELPLDMLSDNYRLNDYDFVLFHIYESNKDYREYYNAMRVVHPDRVMILDNSAYEFHVMGKELDVDAYAQTINILRPDYYIVPDVLMNQKKTLQLVGRWMTDYFYGTTGQPLVVAQGNTESELIQCLDIYKQSKLKNVCIPFHNDFFKNMTVDGDVENCFADAYNLPSLDCITDDMRYAMGRVSFILNNNWVLSNFDYVHLLGSHCPYEKAFYKDCNITSMDTGYPVKLGLSHNILGSEGKKPDVIIDDFINNETPPISQSLIKANIQIFREY